ncbi:putative hemolysin [Prauserella isguenensis]|uniref:Putative hemolysin n=1 Tax=Prauserella isguenensis TaxID=1470180 RepID=A0A839RVY0_9PSEU|nr:GNAT family N-acyltransferase [Prauserella isguenensis]MBB3049325.1 putative hemolysin [Prauserella isguenensis]
MPVLSTASTRTYTARIADSREEIRAAQRLRATVFAGELGADLTAAHGADQPKHRDAAPQHQPRRPQHAPMGTAARQHIDERRRPGDGRAQHEAVRAEHEVPSAERAGLNAGHGVPSAGHAGLDADAFDELCDHLVVTHEPTGELVGTYRILPPNRSPVPYSSTEFDLADLAPLADDIVEAGRSCVAPAHRNGSVITLMWSALARYTLLAGHRYLGGCASVPLGDGGHAATSVWHLASTRHASPPEYRVRPYRPWLPPHAADHPRYADLPPLLRGYLRLGAWVCGPPAHDPDFDVADFYVLLPLADVDDRYLRYLLGDDR